MCAGLIVCALSAMFPGTNTSFARMRQIDAGVLNIGYAEAGPPVILLHGWPYDIHTYVDVAPLLASAGYWPILYRVSESVTRVRIPEEARI
jgi:hypothetical protein